MSQREGTPPAGSAWAVGIRYPDRHPCRIGCFAGCPFALADARQLSGRVSSALRRHHDYNLQLAASALDACIRPAPLRHGCHASGDLGLRCWQLPVPEVGSAVHSGTGGEVSRNKLFTLGDRGWHAATGDLLIVSLKLSRDGRSPAHPGRAAGRRWTIPAWHSSGSGLLVEHGTGLPMRP